MGRERTADTSFDRFEQMLRSAFGLKLLLASLPAEATLEDARKLHRKLKQAGRTRCSFLDRELGIQRPRP
jgi:hypothetical protein